MDEIVEQTSLSKGGVYHYFNNKYDIIYEIFKRGCDYRVDYIKNSMKNLNQNGVDTDFIAQMIVEKILRKDDEMTLYAIFLTQMPFDKNLRKMYERLFLVTQKGMLDVFSNSDTSFIDKDKFNFLGNTINSYIISAHLLDEYDNLNFFRDILKEMIITALIKFKQQKQD